MPARSADTPDEAADPAGLLPVWFERGIVVVAAFVTSVGTIGLALAVTGHYSRFAALIPGAVLAAALTVLAWPRVGRRPLDTTPADRAARRRRRWQVSLPAAAMCVVALATAAYNLDHSATHLAIGRDPGVYTATAKWISVNGNLEIPIDPNWGPDVAPRVAGTYIVDGDRLQFQFNHLAPVLLAEGRDIGGDSSLFYVGSLLTAFALCAIYAAGTRLVRRPWLVLAAVTGLAVSAPQFNVARDTYSETPVQLLLWSGLWMMLVAYQRRRIGLAVLAGAALGATMMARVDSIVYLLPLPILAGLATIAAGTSEKRKDLLRLHRAVLITALPPALLGTYDLVARSGRYYRDLSTQVHQSWQAMAASFVVCLVLVGLGYWRPDLDRFWRRYRNWFGGGLGALSVVTLLWAWFVRPQVMIGHEAPIPLIASLQHASGLAVDSTRSYSESSLVWQTWYLGRPVVALAVIGAGLAVIHAVRRPDPVGPVLLSTVGVGVASLLWKPTIVPDQIWAMRRFVPSTFPLFLLLAAFAIGAAGHAVHRLVRAYLPASTHRASPGSTGSNSPNRTSSRIRRVIPPTVAGAVLVVGAVVLVAGPARNTRPIRGLQVQAGNLRLVQDTCRTVGPNAAIVMTADGASRQLATSLTAWCRAPIAYLPKSYSAAKLSDLAGRWKDDGRTLWIVGPSAKSVQAVLPGAEAQLVGTARAARSLALTLQRPSRRFIPAVTTVYAAAVRT